MKVGSRILLSLLLVSLSLMLSCLNGRIKYSSFSNIYQGKWLAYDQCSFEIDSVSFDKAKRYDLVVELTFNSSFRPDTVSLQVSHNFITPEIKCDTIEYRVKDKYGKWIGNGVGGLYQISLPFLENIPLQDTILYRAEILQATGEWMLKGIEKVGLTIYER